MSLAGWRGGAVNDGVVVVVVSCLVLGGD